MKNILLAVGISLVVALVVGAGVYFFVFRAKNSAGTSTQLPSSNATFDEQQKPQANSTPQTGTRVRFHQLTTRPVVGATFMNGNVRYVEQGTGYIYDVLAGSNSETQVSNTTVPGVVNALFSPTGEYVALTTEDSGVRSVIVGSVKQVGVGELDGKELPSGAYEIGFIGTSSVGYLLKNDVGSGAYAYNLTTNTSSELFTIPLRDVRVLWGKKTYVYTTPSAHALGYLYQLDGGTLRPVGASGLGLTALTYSDGVLVGQGTSDGGVLTSYLLTASSSKEELAFGFLADKCVQGSGVGIVYCAEQQSTLPSEYPDSWYRGSVSMNDVLWKINTVDRSTVLMADPLVETGREVDVLRLGTNLEGTMLWFINKNDHTLWTFNIS